jgi:hypothetical protein
MPLSGGGLPRESTVEFVGSLSPDEFYKGNQEKTPHLWPEFFFLSSPFH